MQDALWCLGDDGGQDPASVYRGEVVAGEPAGLEGFGQQAWRWRRQARDTGHNCYIPAHERVPRRFCAEAEAV